MKEPIAGDSVELFWATKVLPWRRDVVAEVLDGGRFRLATGCVRQVADEGKEWRWPKRGPVG